MQHNVPEEREFGGDLAPKSTIYREAQALSRPMEIRFFLFWMNDQLSGNATQSSASALEHSAPSATASFFIAPSSTGVTHCTSTSSTAASSESLKKQSITVRANGLYEAFLEWIKTSEPSSTYIVGRDRFSATLRTEFACAKDEMAWSNSGVMYYKSRKSEHRNQHVWGFNFPMLIAYVGTKYRETFS